jgi:hypothetical protein
VLLWVLHQAQTAANRFLTHHDLWMLQRSLQPQTRQLLTPLRLAAAVGQLQTQPKMPPQHQAVLLLLLLMLRQQDHGLLLLLLLPPPDCRCLECP